MSSEHNLAMAVAQKMSRDERVQLLNAISAGSANTPGPITWLVPVRPTPLPSITLPTYTQVEVGEGECSVATEVVKAAEVVEAERAVEEAREAKELGKTLVGASRLDAAIVATVVTLLTTRHRKPKDKNEVPA